jgi:hypothetical protein
MVPVDVDADADADPADDAGGENADVPVDCLVPGGLIGPRGRRGRRSPR